MSNQFKASVVRGVGWSVVGSWGTRLVTFVVFTILARILGPEAYGLIAFAGVFLTVLDIFSDVSFGAAIEQRQDLEPAHLDTIFWTFLALGGLLTTASLVGAPLVASFFEEPDLTPVIRWLSLGFMLQMVSGVHKSLLRRDLKMDTLAAVTMAGNIAGAVIGISMAWMGAGVWSIVGQRLVLRVVTVVLIWRQSTWRPQRRFSWALLKDVSGFGMSMMGNRVLNYFNRQFDQLLIGRVLGKTELGLYFAASRLYILVNTMLVGTISQVAMPALAKLQDDRPRFQRAYIKACRFICLLALPVFVGMSLLSEEFILVFTGDQWQASIPALRVLALVGVVHSIQYVNGAAIMALGRADLRLWSQVIHSVVNIVGFILVVRHGFVAVATAYTIRAWILLPLDLALGRWLGAVRLRPLATALLPQTIATAIMAATVYWFRISVVSSLGVLPRLFILTTVGAIAYGALITLMNPSLVTETKDLVRAARSPRGPRRKELP